jgi:cysteine desulfurase
MDVTSRAYNHHRVPSARPATAALRGLIVMEPIYLDSNATTPLHPAAWEAMLPHLRGAAGNPASAHRFGRLARKALEDGRERLAALLDAHADEVVFTSGATEANNLALLGLAGQPPGHLLASPVEHPSVTEPLLHLSRIGFTLDTLRVTAEGQVCPQSLSQRLRPETRLVAVQLANHETGAVHPIKELVALLPAEVPLHCDAVQAIGKIPVSFRQLGVATLALSGHKFHGPPGIGALLIRRGLKVPPQLRGGHQQQGRRPGTEPVALVVGLVAALETACQEGEARRRRLRQLRQRLLDRLRSEASPVILNGPEEGGLAHTLNVSFPPVRGDALLMALDLAGVACSTGSACSSGSLLPSPVLQAMGVSDDILRGALRLSLHALHTDTEIDEAARRIVQAVRRLRGNG